MNIKTYSKSINWNEIGQLLEYDDVCIKVPEFLILIKKCKDFKIKFERTIKILQNYSPNNWLLFFYNSKFSNIEKTYEIKFSLNEYINKNYDIRLLRMDGKIYDSLCYIRPRKIEKKANDNIFELAFSDKTNITTKHRRKLSLQDAGQKARTYLNHKVNGNLLIDASSSHMAGVAYTYRDGNYKNKSYGYGRGWDYPDAINIALLEAVERFVSQFYDYDPLDNSIIYDNYKSIKNNAYSPSKYILEDTSNVDEDTYMFWSKAQSVISGKYIWVPEDLVVYGNNIFRDNYKRMIHDSSNGVSLGGSYAEAMIGALMELVERHSFLATWFGEVPGKNIPISSQYLDENMIHTINNLTNNFYNIRLFEISVIEGVYVVWCLIINDSDNSTMYSYSAAGSGLTIEEAINDALTEAIVGMSVYSNNQDDMPKTPSKIMTLEDHVRFYGNRKCKDSFTFTKYFKNKTRYYNFESINHLDNLGRKLQYLVNKISAKFDDILFVNLTSDALKYNKLYAVKAIVPGMFPMTFGDDSLRISLDLINKLRTKNNLKELIKLKKGPHPFP